MGTSVSQPSERSTNWRRVLICYENNKIPQERLVNEIWRASENESIPISNMLKTDAIFSCYEAVKTSKNYSEALTKFNQKIIELKGNSIIAEFAKRVIPIAFQAKNPSEQWTKSLFSEITNYVVSRDAPGFVGEGNRNQSVQDLIEFKKGVSNHINQIIITKPKQFSSKKGWNSFVDESISKLETKQ